MVFNIYYNLSYNYILYKNIQLLISIYYVKTKTYNITFDYLWNMIQS